MPFITVPSQPKFPLTESELNWLKERKTEHNCRFLFCYACSHYDRSQDQNMCTYVPPYHGEFCAQEHENQDFEDAAEFSERVASKMVQINYGMLPCGSGPDCTDQRMGKYNTYETPALGCDMCALRAARLIVEEEMEREYNRRKHNHA